MDTSRQILIVEDNRDGRESLRILLQLWGYKVLVAENGLQAVEMALTEHPDIALVDIGLPVLDGYEVARRLRSGPHGHRIHLIALTGYGQPEDRRRALEAGFDAHLIKPVEPEDLGRLLEGLVANSASS